MGTLKQTLQSMLVTARQVEGRPVRRSLPRGLTVEVVQDPGGNIVLTLERLNTEPGSDEWTTVLKHFPESVPAGIVPTPRKDGRRHALVGRWPRPAEISEPAA